MNNKRNFVIAAAIALFIVIAFVIGAFFYHYGTLISEAEEGRPEVVEFNDANDLYKITNINFPDVELVDSSYTYTVNVETVTAKFLLRNADAKKALIDSIQNKLQPDSIYWTVTDSCYVYYILPEFPIDRPSGTGWRKTHDGSLDSAGDFIRMDVPLDSDTITLVYGWKR